MCSCVTITKRPSISKGCGAHAVGDRGHERSKGKGGKGVVIKI